MKLLLPLREPKHERTKNNNTVLLILGEKVMCLKKYMKIKITLLKLINRGAWTFSSS